jgi:PEP-CTERM motif-containing protein
MILRALRVVLSPLGVCPNTARNGMQRGASTQSCRVALALLVVLTLPLSAAGAPILFEGFGADASAIQSSVDAFRAALGNPNNGNTAGPLASGRREINWDGGGLATTISPTPFSGFQNIRGALFTTSGTGFVQAPPSGLATDPTFGNPTYAGFDVFSSARLFSPVGSTLTNVAFSVPGTNGGVSATVTGFGAVFSDVDSAANASLSFVNASGVSLGTFFVPAASNGLSFLGLVFPDDAISQVQIISGNVPLGPSESGAIDIIVMDDFLYSEPAVVPEPATLFLFGTTAAGLGLARWRQRRRKQQP